MGHRLSKIYTRTGDDGTTGLADGTRIDKNHPRVVAFGAIDELNCQLGLLLAESLPPDIESVLSGIQHQLFDLGAELSMPGREIISDQDSTDLESRLDRWNAGLEPLKEFILPGGSRAAALCHVARSVNRRAECALVALSRVETVSRPSIKFLNRLSDLLFVLARFLNRLDGRSDVPWKPTPKG